MAYCLTAISHFLNQCWIFIGLVQLDNLRIISQWVHTLLFCKLSLKKLYFLITSISSRGQWVKGWRKFKIHPVLSNQLHMYFCHGGEPKIPTDLPEWVGYMIKEEITRYIAVYHIWCNVIHSAYHYMETASVYNHYLIISRNNYSWNSCIFLQGHTIHLSISNVMLVLPHSGISILKSCEWWMPTEDSHLKIKIQNIKSCHKGQDGYTNYSP